MIEKTKEVHCGCGTQFDAKGYRVSLSVLFIGECPSCTKTYTCLAGTPGEVMAQSILFADLYCQTAFQAGEVLGVADPFLLDADQLAMYARQ